MAGYNAGRPTWVELYPTEKLLENLQTGPEAVTLVDVGGGMGQDVERFRAKHPKQDGRLMLQDRKEVIESAKLDSSIEATAHDFFTPQPVKGKPGPLPTLTHC